MRFVICYRLVHPHSTARQVLIAEATKLNDIILEAAAAVGIDHT